MLAKTYGGVIINKLDRPALSTKARMAKMREDYSIVHDLTEAAGDKYYDALKAGTWNPTRGKNSYNFVALETTRSIQTVANAVKEVNIYDRYTVCVDATCLSKYKIKK